MNPPSASVARPRRSGRAWTAASAAALLVPFVACTFLVNRDSMQCQQDSDCEHFGGHPYCQGGACVSSGMGPADCFYGTPTQPADFLNQCSNAQCLSFDNCQRLRLCGTASDMDAALVAPSQVDGSSAPPVLSDGGGSVLPTCPGSNGNVTPAIYLTGSSNFPPLLAKLAPLILTAGYTPVYQVTNSCTGVASVLSSNASAHVIHDPPSGGKYAAYYRQDGSSASCLLGPNGATIDVGESDIFSSTCSGYSAPGPGVEEYLGPIQAMVFVVPGASSQQTISAEAARAVFGMGGDADTAAPWTDSSLYFVRNQSTGTQQMIGKAIRVPANEFWGIDRGTATAIDEDLRVISDPTIANQAIGIISADYYDADRSNLHALAFKAEGQTCAYLPDSTPFNKDKQNIRDGHYPIWGPVHFFTAVSNGIPVSPAAAAFMSVVSVPNLPQQLLDAFIASSLVPMCAMTVQRSAELGPLSMYSPPFECDCYFEASLSGNAPSACTECKTANDCVDPQRPACNLGYCEAH